MMHGQKNTKLPSAVDSIHLVKKFPLQLVDFTCWFLTWGVKNQKWMEDYPV